MGALATKQADFENRNGAYIRVREYRKRRKPPFAGRHHLNLSTSQITFSSLNGWPAAMRA